MRLDGLASAEEAAPGGAFRAALGRLPAPEMRPAGFSLLAAACFAGFVGLAAALFSQSVDGMQRYAYREVAGAALGLGLAMFLAGAATSLPLAGAARVAGAVGFGLACVGVASFVMVYPYLWNTSRDYSVFPVLTFAAGMSLLAAANANGLIASYVQSREARARARADDVSEEEVLRDLEDTTRRQRLTWGGMHADDRAIELSGVGAGHVQLLGGSLDRLGLVERMREDELDEDVHALLSFRGVKAEASEEFDDSDTLALVSLRQQQEEASRRTWRGRLLAMFRR